MSSRHRPIHRGFFPRRNTRPFW